MSPKLFVLNLRRKNLSYMIFIFGCLFSKSCSSNHAFLPRSVLPQNPNIRRMFSPKEPHLGYNQLNRVLYGCFCFLGPKVFSKNFPWDKQLSRVLYVSFCSTSTPPRQRRRFPHLFGLQNPWMRTPSQPARKHGWKMMEVEGLRWFLEKLGKFHLKTQYKGRCSLNHVLLILNCVSS